MHNLFEYHLERLINDLSSDLNHYKPLDELNKRVPFRTAMIKDSGYRYDINTNNSKAKKFKKELVDANIKINALKILREEYEEWGIQEYMDSLRYSKIKNSVLNNMTESEKYLYEQRQIIARITSNNYLILKPSHNYFNIV